MQTRNSRRFKIFICTLLICSIFVSTTVSSYAVSYSALNNAIDNAISLSSSIVSTIKNFISNGITSSDYSGALSALLTELEYLRSGFFSQNTNGPGIYYWWGGTQMHYVTPNFQAFAIGSSYSLTSIARYLKDTYDLENTHLNGIGSIVDQIYTQVYNQNANHLASNVLLSSINYNTSKYRYNDGLVDLFKRAGGVLQSNSFAYSGFNTDVSFHTYYVMNIAFSVNANATTLQKVIYDVTLGDYVPLYYVYEPYGGIAYCFFRLTAGHDYKLMGSRMSGYKYVPIYLGNDYFLPDELRPFFYLKSPIDYYTSIDNKLSGLATIDSHVDGVEGLLNSISLNTDTVESKLTTIDGHIDGVESKLDLIHEDLLNLPSGCGDSNTDIDVDLDLNFVDIAADLGVSVDFLKDTLDTGVDIPDSLALLMLPDYFFTRDVYDTVNGSYPDVELVPLSDL